jgi:prepilin-type N-terminal cleavage/methylation domain-containing protein
MNGRARGYTLIEVLIGMVIFALGMMALAQLQGGLARNSTDSNARTVAANIAEEVIESARAFNRIDSDGVNPAYNDIVDSTQTLSRGGNTYAVITDVTNYWYSGGSFGTTAPVGGGRPDMKLVELTVTWNDEDDGQQFRVDESTTAPLGSGSITIRDVISSIPSGSGGKVALGGQGDNAYAPPVDYNPGENPDIISIQLGDNKFKESTTPLPDVIRSDELVETRFDVVTYSQDDSGATFLRREEFRAVSCECTLNVPASDDEGGLRPTIWNGNDYTEGEFVSKPYGTEANNQQSEFCDVCCRDHHDGGTGVNDDVNDTGKSQYNPFRSAANYYDGSAGALAGDHKHYNRNNSGQLELADTDGDTYVEACRMVRKDGFWRIAQDLRQEGLNAFPADYLDDEEEVGEYSEYVTDAVTAYEEDVGTTNYYEQMPPSLGSPGSMDPAVVFPASTPATATVMQDGVTTEQQLRSRGIYVDYMSDELRTRINCLDMGGTGDGCDVPDVTTALEIIPFYDVQLTWLSRWTESPDNTPIDVTNEAIADDNAHSRGIATLQQGYGTSTIESEVHKGNLGLTGTDPIDPQYVSELEEYPLYALAIEWSSPPPVSGIQIVGTITSAVPGVKAADVEIEATGAQCDRTSVGFECVLLTGATSPRLKIFNYAKQNKTLLGCSVNGNLSVQGNDTGSNPWTRFNLPLTETLNADIVIRENNC